MRARAEPEDAPPVGRRNDGGDHDSLATQPTACFESCGIDSVERLKSLLGSGGIVSLTKIGFSASFMVGACCSRLLAGGLRLCVDALRGV